MHRIQSFKGLLNSHQIRLAKPATYIHVSCHEGDSVRDCGEAAHKDELDLR